MVTPSTAGQPDNGNEEEQISYAQYVIDPEAATAIQRSLPMLVASRRCYMDQQADDEISTDNEDLAMYIKRIADHCSHEQDYLLPDTPLKEAIFRVMLSEGNRPINAEDISGVLTSKWAMTPFPRNTSPEVIQRLLSASGNYCISRIPDPEPEPVAEPPAAEPSSAMADAMAESTPPEDGAGE
jgi:hypothetical protein